MAGGQKQKMSKSVDPPVSNAKRIFGWAVAAIYVLGLYFVVPWIEEEARNLPDILLAPIALVLGMGGWVLLLWIGISFDLFGDRRKK